MINYSGFTGTATVHGDSIGEALKTLGQDWLTVSCGDVMIGRGHVVGSHVVPAPKGKSLTEKTAAPA